MRKNSGIVMVGTDATRTFNSKYFHKRCVTCDAYGYKTADDYKHKRKYCFTLDRYISKPDDMVCPHWKPTD